MINKTIIKVENLDKKFFLKNSTLHILKSFSLNVYAQDIISIKGPSGCGKSTFLNIIGMLDSNFLGSYDFMNENAWREEASCGILEVEIRPGRNFNFKMFITSEP